MTDSEKTTPGEPAGSVTGSADPISALPISAQPQTVAVTDPRNLLPVLPSPRRPEDAPNGAPADADEPPADELPADELPVGELPTAEAADDERAADGPADEGAGAPGAGRAGGPRSEARAVRVITAVTIAAAVVVAGGVTALVLTWPAGGNPAPITGPTATGGAACLVGTWRSTQLIMANVAATGTETLAFHSDGTGVDTLDRVTVSSPDGHTHMYDGAVMFRYVAATSIINITGPSGTLVDRDLTAEITRTETPAYAPKNFACSPTSLTLTNGADVSRFTRS